MEVIVDFIDENKEELGVEPVCKELQVATSTYYAARSRPPSARSTRDALLVPILVAIWSGFAYRRVQPYYARYYRRGGYARRPRRRFF